LPFAQYCSRIKTTEKGIQMPYKLVEGEVKLFYRSTRMVGSRPDGDSAWFKPDNPKLLSDIGHRSANFNKGGFTQLRFEGIDALELHYPGSDHQLSAPAVAARDYLLKQVGFDTDKIQCAPSSDIPTTVRSCKPVAVRAHILARAIDPFGRPVAFVFAGKAPELSGSDLFLDSNRLDKSLNAALMRQGHVYPAYYSAREVNGERVGGLPGDLRQHLTVLANSAINANRGIWPLDLSTDSPKITKKSDLFNLALWPKLYRRLAKYYDDENANHNSLSGFRDWLHEDRRGRDDLMLVLPIGELLNLSDIVTITPNSISMNYLPTELVIIPR
jgi:endonuclease YncB( thermonuclease family)